MTDELLPELPTPHSIRPNSGARLYTEAQMHAYARESIRLARDDGESALWALRQIIHDLPTRRDWLCPDLEKVARKLVERNPYADLLSTPPAGEVA